MKSPETVDSTICIVFFIAFVVHPYISDNWLDCKFWEGLRHGKRNIWSGHGYRQSHWARLTMTVCILFCSWWECAWVHYRGGSLRGDSMTDGWLKLVFVKEIWSDQWASALLKQEANQWVAWGGRVYSNQLKNTFFIPQPERNFISDFRLWAFLSTVCEHDVQSFTVAKWRDLLQNIVNSRNGQGNFFNSVYVKKIEKSNLFLCAFKYWGIHKTSNE